MKLTGVVVTKNEEKSIENVIKNLSFCDEVIVCDNNSLDKTRLLAKSLKARVIKKKFTSYADQRNFALLKARGEWILYLDADEEISKDLQKEILEAIKTNDYMGYNFKRLDIFHGKHLRHGEVGDIRLTRLAKNSAGKWERIVHEKWVINGKIGELINPIIHRPHNSVFDFINKINLYFPLHAEQNVKDGKSSDLAKIIFIPKLKFFANYIGKLGFLDGTHGFVVGIIMSLHSFLSWSQIYLDLKNPKN